jgi:phage terminase large subunit
MLIVLLILFNMHIQFDYSGFRENTNEAFWPFFAAKNRYALPYGGRGSSKSHHVVIKHLIRIQKAIAKKGKIPEKYVFFRKTQPALRRSVVELTNHYIDKMGMRSITDFNKNEMEFEFPNKNKILCIGLDDSEKIKSLEGINSCWYEEATEGTAQDIIDIDMIMRAPTSTYHQMTLSFNPILESHHLNQTYFAGGVEWSDSSQRWGYSKAMPDTFIHRSTYKDNKFLIKGYGEILERLREQNPALYDVYALGKWGTLEGLIWSNWEEVAEFPLKNSFDDYWYGIDFGYNHPTVIVMVGSKDGEYFEKELLYQSGLTNNDLIAKMEELRVDRSHPIYADSAEPARIEEIGRAGYNIYPANKSVKDGIDYLKSFRQKIHGSSVNGIKEMRGYSYMKDRNGNYIDEPVKVFDDYCAARRYAYYTHHIRNCSSPFLFTEYESTQERT